MCKLSALWLKWPVDSRLPAFWVTGARNEAWALLQKLLSMNYSNLVTAAFNYNTGREKQKETDGAGTTVWGLQGKKYKYRDVLGSWGLKTPKSANPEESRGCKWMERFSLEESHSQIGEVTRAEWGPIAHRNLQTRLRACCGKIRSEPHTLYVEHIRKQCVIIKPQSGIHVLV